MVSFTTVTSGASASSRSVKSRPRDGRMPMTSKYVGVDTWMNASYVMGAKLTEAVAAVIEP